MLFRSEIRVHSNIYEPDFVVVVDEGLLDVVHVTDGLKKDGGIIVNTAKTPDEIREKLNGYAGKVYTIDARKVSVACLGRYFPNTPMLAAIVKVSQVMEKDTFFNEMETSFSHKFASKPEVIEGNMNALRMAFEEVR